MLAVLALQAPFSWLGKCRAWDNMKPLPLHVCGKQVEKSDFHCEFPNAKEISEHGSFLCAREGEGHFATELVPVSLSRPFAPNLRFSLSLALPCSFQHANVRKLCKNNCKIAASYIDDHKTHSTGPRHPDSFALKMIKLRQKSETMMAGSQRWNHTPKSWWKAGSCLYGDTPWQTGW